MTFKIGDEVIFIDKEIPDCVGKLGKVVLIHEQQGTIQVTSDCRMLTGSWYYRRFRKLSKLEKALK